MQLVHTWKRAVHCARCFASTVMSTSVLNGANIESMSNPIIVGGDMYIGLLKSSGRLLSDNIDLITIGSSTAVEDPFWRGPKSIPNRTTFGINHWNSFYLKICNQFRTLQF